MTTPRSIDISRLKVGYGLKPSPSGDGVFTLIALRIIATKPCFEFCHRHIFDILKFLCSENAQYKSLRR